MTSLLMTTQTLPVSKMWKQLAPLCGMVFLEFLAMGLPLPILPIRVHDGLGF